MPAAKSARVGAEVQPQSSEFTSAKTAAPRPNVSNARPGQSIFGSALSSRTSGVTARSRSTAPTTIGTLITKISRQSRSESTPPISGPIPRAIAETAVQIPIAFGCSAGGKTNVTSASESGSIDAAPTAITTRPAISTSGFGAAAQTTEPRPKTANPARKTRRRPKMSPSRPAVTTSAATTSR